MANCQACGAEKSERDRFCRNCGRQIATIPGEKVDTSRFNSSELSSAVVQPSADDPTIKFYDPPVAYQMAQDSFNSLPIESAGRRALNHWGVWLVIPLLLSILIATGITFGINSRRANARQADQAEIVRRSSQDTIRNALGLNPGIISATEFPDIQGIFIDSLISDDSPAALANIQAGDVLMELSDQAVRNLSELAAALEPLPPGADVTVKLYRDGGTISSRIRVGDRSFPPLVAKTPLREQGFLGIYDSSRRCCIPGTKRWGVEILRVVDNSPAYLAGLLPGDVIVEFAGQPVRTQQEWGRRIRGVKPRSKVAVKFYRGNTEQIIEMILGHR